MRVWMVIDALTNHVDEGGRRARQRAVAPVNEPELPPNVHVGNGDHFRFARAHLVPHKTLGDQRDAQARRHESFDHTDARQLHSDVQARAERAKLLVVDLAHEPGLRENQRLLGNFSGCDAFLLRQGFAGLVISMMRLRKIGWTRRLGDLTGRVTMPTSTVPSSIFSITWWLKFR